MQPRVHLRKRLPGFLLCLLHCPFLRLQIQIRLPVQQQPRQLLLRLGDLLKKAQQKIVQPPPQIIERLVLFVGDRAGRDAAALARLLSAQQHSPDQRQRTCCRQRNAGSQICLCQQHAPQRQQRRAQHQKQKLRAGKARLLFLRLRFLKRLHLLAPFQLRNPPAVRLIAQHLVLRRNAGGKHTPQRLQLVLLLLRHCARFQRPLQNRMLLFVLPERVQLLVRRSAVCKAHARQIKLPLLVFRQLQPGKLPPACQHLVCRLQAGAYLLLPRRGSPEFYFQFCQSFCLFGQQLRRKLRLQLSQLRALPRAFVQLLLRFLPVRK